MAARGSSYSSPRSVADATRFTSNTPHAKTKAAASKPGTASATGRPANSSPSKHPLGSGVGGGLPPSGTPVQATHETPEERVRRLRAAHLAAKQHTVSRFDRIVDSSRRFFDAAHKFSLAGLIGFSGLALFVTVYASADMMIYNRRRRGEFFAMQKQLKEDSLESARLAYMAGTATEDQIALVEEATAKARQDGLQLPPLLSAPRPAAPAGGRDATADQTERTVWSGEAIVESNISAADDVEQPKKKGLIAWLVSGLKKEELREDLDFDNEEASASGRASQSGITKTIDESQQVFKEKAKAAFDQERENQRRGGPLDQVGLENKSGSNEGKKGW
ncbi:hypothetical protein F5X99DRAFT_76087 [Biscogniauxia marginata]|nr:hypothetical protein F5X99DRAFT_76087 [Biscogniauxia marginata]